MSGGVGGVGGRGAPDFEPESPILDDPALASVGHGAAVLKRGSRGEGVADLQRGLVLLGLLPATPPPDGVFGRNTENAVAAFQRSQGLAPDGKVGRQTLAALDRALLAPPGTGPSRPAAPPPSTPPSRPAGTYLHSDAERRVFDLAKEKLFLGARMGRFDLGVSDQEATAVLDALDALPPASHKNVTLELATTRQRPDDPQTYLDTFVAKGTSDAINFALTTRYWNQLKAKLGALGERPQDTVVPLLSTVAAHDLMTKVRFAGIE